ncbi:hypothetical protein QN372_00575 [Undibacterium sp. RTI2.1]|uniref:hypothetical protein n=1 Tax=unclassified Undibacterium TaxID=2630295 RepID=UPI002AB57452|nr:MULTISPECIES: hypothetical protein [unclassified Undibacterium]MDY7537633.1 hypothetical protein [Undibacterium sp. 5I1]MEB0029234.1 hypothetical protein [Undibacterium sp. RTI2.1]MEB0115542.1 hypothetical protein [Undibacterium sp. RTI2.2]MEB0230178.1 hypothetical protein [Undibacterium sp. 10I3]MEB0256370.1 hypothetical protein [Undibacterium sp. 5I1]
MTHPINIEFYGSQVGFDECEVLAIQNIHHKLLIKEAALFSKKWFDYRSMHPTLATYLAVHHYNRAYGYFMGVAMDKGKKYMAGFRGKDFMLSREKQSFWKLRQQADDTGIRYDFFMLEAMKWCIENGWRQPPRPAHISTNNDLLIQVMNKWEMESRAKIQWATDCRYRAELFVGSPDQLAYENHIATRIMQKPHPKFAIYAALYQYDALRIEEALRRFPTETINDAMHVSVIFSQK